MTATVTGFASDAIKLIRERLPAPAWAVVLVVAVSSVLNGLIPAGHTSKNVTIALVGIGLWLFQFWASAVVTRFMAAQPGSRWAIDGAFVRFLGPQMIVTIFTAAVIVAERQAVLAVHHQPSFAAEFSAQILISLAMVPFAAWFVALAIGDRSVGVGRCLRTLHGAILPLMGATLLLVLPIQLFHAALASTAIKLTSMPLRTALGVADGLISAFAVVVLPWALFTAAWRYIKGEAVHETPSDDDIA